MRSFAAVSRNPERLLDPQDPTLAWDLLSNRIEALVTAWESTSEPPRLADFLPAEPTALRRLALVELIKVDLDYRCRRPEHSRRIEQYLDEFPDLAPHGDVPCDLIYEEYHLRKQSGQPVEVDEYFARFPRQAAELGRLLGLESPQLSTSVVGAARFEEIGVGETLDDFDLLTRLGRGAFATVFLARQQSMQRFVALKVSADRGNEPQTMALLDHPHIVRVFDQRRLPDRRIRLLYMQYVPGGTLQSVVDAIKRLPPSMRTGVRLLEVIDQALSRARRESAHGFAPAPSSGHGQLAAGGVLAGVASGGCAGLRASTWRAAPRREAGQCAAHGRRHAEAGRFQHQLLLESGRRLGGGVLWRQPGLHVPRAARGLQPGPRAGRG